MPIDGWIDHAERALHVLARDLRAVPVNGTTRRLHLRALELKRDVARWHDAEPDVPSRCAVLDAIEELSREVVAARRRESRASRAGARSDGLDIVAREFTRPERES